MKIEDEKLVPGAGTDSSRVPASWEEQFRQLQVLRFFFIFIINKGDYYDYYDY